MNLTTGCLVLVGGLVLSFTSCSKKKDLSIVATVGDHAITIDEVRSEVGRRQKDNRPIPEKHALVEEMVTREALLQRAKSSGLEEDVSVRREIGNLLIGKFKDRELTPLLDAVVVTEDELKAAYTANIAGYSKPAKDRLAVLFLKTSPKMNDVRRAELRERLIEARRIHLADPARGGRGPAAGAFGALAIDYSDDQASRYRGGDVGWLDRDRFSYRWPREVLEAGYGLEKDQVSEIIDTKEGLFLVTKTDFREGATTAFDQVKESLRRRLVLIKRREIEQAFPRDCVRLAPGEIHEHALNMMNFSWPVETTIARNGDLKPPRIPGVQPFSNGN